MSDEIKLELKKPLDKMTAKELRQLVIEKIPQITGASGMDKETLLASIKEVMGITDEEGSQDKAAPLWGRHWPKLQCGHATRRSPCSFR